MDIVVCVKQVPDTTDVKIDPVTNSIIRQGVPSVLNPFDKHAVEAGLQLKEKHGGKVTVISMGPPQAKDALKECLALGADEAVLISDRSFGGADTLATSYTLASAIKKIGNFDVILCGKQSIDGDTAQVGPELAEHLGIVPLTYAADIEVEGNTVLVKREQEDCYEMVEAKLPVLITVVKSINDPRHASIKGIMKANRKTIPVLSQQDLDIDSQRIGLNGSPTQVRRIFAPNQRVQGEIIQSDNAKEAAHLLVQKLLEAKII
ncbi:Caffeyl-CoA reductase-Etf complex subunit CarD [bioreactor metagenome]|uniref:Caffeyl-CoA reductase-Etf complex subunit CarD n=1 Tax=bioreactor metagenome TaxID=1076179 RepID=A0A644UR75_9ZZZZ|nr:electron transfer flavoprotein subunit beta/FixA family protein [Negativicutes bacterium]